MSSDLGHEQCEATTATTGGPLVRRRTVLLGTTALAAATSSSALLSTPAATASVATATAAPPPMPRKAIWFDNPGTNWEAHALPIGNGRLGAMLFGGVGTDTVQLNEISLWGGLNNYDNGLAGQGDGAYDTHVRGFGSYRNFGEVAVELAGGARTQISGSSGGTDSTSGESVAQTYDGQAGTKWCIIAPNGGSTAWQVTWLADLASAATVSQYSLTSANDVPERDPQVWRFEGSQDGNAWTTLDSRTHASTPFTARGQRLSFDFNNTTAYAHYRFVFEPKTSVTHWQVAEIGLSGVDLRGQGTATDYRRWLDPMTGIHGVSFSSGGATQVREAFVSRDADLIVLRYRTDSTAGLRGTVSLTSAQTGNTPGDNASDAPQQMPAYQVAADGSRISFNGIMGNGLKHAADVEVRHVGGTLAGTADRVSFDGCSELELRIDLRTDYRMSQIDGWRNGLNPVSVAAATLASARTSSYDDLRARHVDAFGAIMNRVTLDWGRSADDVVAMSIPARRARYAASRDNLDPELEQMEFIFSRYLLASSSRADGLPANLQGLWNNMNQPPWASDFHTNINLQMNYWGALVTDLPDSNIGLVNYIDQVAEPSRIATRHAFGQNIRGWTARTSQSAFGGNSWEWNMVASAWYMQHVYEHWKFNPADTNFLNRAYSMLKEICEFWEDRLVERQVDGATVLMSPMGWSPEHGPVEDGVMYDQQIIWDLFSNYLELAAAAGRDVEYQATVRSMRDRLAPNKIGSWGQLQEWQTDRDSQTDLHRHTSHLFAVYPGRQISVSQTPELATAALKSLNARCGVPGGDPIGDDTVSGDSRRSWTWPWRTALFARLGEPERAYTMVRGLLKHNSLDNLFATHPPFQIDGNLGISGGIAEMLLQSHEGDINLLPALPQAWRASGSFTGLRARGGFKVSATWVDGQVTSYEIVADRAPTGASVRVKVNGQYEQWPPVGNGLGQGTRPNNGGAGRARRPGHAENHPRPPAGRGRGVN